MIENLTDLERSLKLPDGTLKAAIESADSVKIELPKLKVYTEEEDNTRVDNLRNEFKTAGVEVAVKEARNKHGLDFQGKNIDNLLDSFKAKVLADANINPDKRVAELTTDIEKLRNNLAAEQAKFNELQGSVQRERDQMSVDREIMDAIPDGLMISKEDALMLFKSKYAIEKTETGKVIKQNGETLKNTTTLSPLGMKDVMESFIAPYVKAPSGGAGKGDDTGKDKPGSLAAFTKEMEAKGVTAGSASFQAEMTARIKAKTLVI